jgi:hypothetical protein
MTYKVTPADRKATFEAARRLGLNPYEFGAVLDKESGINPNIWGGAGGKYYGAIQFGGPERSEAGLDPQKIGNYTLAEQMPHIEKWLVGRGFKPGMGVDKVYATILAGNPNANLDAKDSFGTSVNNALEGLRKGGSNYQRAQQVLGPAPYESTMPVAAGDQVPAQTAAAATTDTTTLPDGTVININIGKGQTDPKTPRFDPNEFIMEHALNALRKGTSTNAVVNDLIKQARSGGYVSAKDAMALFGGFE